MKIHLFDEARAVALELAVPVRTQIVSLQNASACVLAQPIFAKIDVPPFDRAMMDGYAVKSADLAEPATDLTVIGSVAAGETSPLTVGCRQAVRIMTGAPIPTGADAVVRHEWCSVSSSGDVVRVLRPVRPGESIQTQGDDAKCGQVLLHPGTRLKGMELAVCKTFGVSSVEIVVPPRIGLIVTGSELVQDSSTLLQRGQIYGANDIFLKHALEDDGASVTNVQYAPDDIELLKRAISGACEQNDYLILTGGVSAGDFDFVPAVLRRLAGTLRIEKVLMRPGSPFVVCRIGACSVFGLSGNPAASFIQFETLVRPAIRASLGLQDDVFSSTGKLLHPIRLKPIKHTRFFRARASIQNAEVVIDAELSQSSGVLSEFSHANCLIRLDESLYDKGDILPLRWIKSV